MSANAETQLAQRQILLVGPYGVLPSPPFSASTE
jgi:hypothetical protein